MTFIPNHIIAGAVDAIITARDFCGNEREAVRDFAIENGFKADWQKIAGIANFRANSRWNAFKRAAGVAEKHLF
jgi:hypothetical protein